MAQQPEEHAPFEYGIDSNVRDIMKLYGRKPLDLAFLGYGEKTTHGLAYVYSEEVLRSLGQTGPAVDKGCFNKGSAKDGGPPWARSLTEEPILSLNRQDYTVKQKLVPREEPPIDARAVMRTRERIARAQRNAESTEREKAFEERLKKQLEDEADVQRRNVGDTVKVFDHRGVRRRPAILEKTDEDRKVEDLIRTEDKRKKNRACPPPSLLPVEESIFDPLKNPLLGGEAGTALPSLDPEQIATETVRARRKCLSPPRGMERNEGDLLIERADAAVGNARSGAVSVLNAVRNAEKVCEGTRSATSMDSKASTVTKGKAFWYPKDRQRLKFHLLEEMRVRDGKLDLLNHGWATATNPAGNAKKVGRPDLHTSLSEEDQSVVNAEVDAYIAARNDRKEALKRKEQAMLRKAAEMQNKEHEQRTRQHQGSPTEPSVPPYATDSDIDQADAARVASMIIQSNKRVNGLEAASPTFRPELPGNMPPKQDQRETDKKDTSTVAEDPDDVAIPAQPTNILGVQPRALAPPWGRQTAQDDKWAKVRVYDARAKKLRFEPVAKLEIDRELRICRDKGLMKKERKSLLSKLDAKQIQYIKNSPAVNTTMTHSVLPMKQARQPTKSTL